MPDALWAMLVVVPVTLLSHKLTQWWARRKPAGAFLGMLVGVILRAIVIVGGGLAVYLWTRSLGFWFWLIGIYLSTLALELCWLVRRRRGRDSSR